MMDQSSPFMSNHTLISSVQVTLSGSWKQKLLKTVLEKILIAESLGHLEQSNLRKNHTILNDTDSKHSPNRYF